MKKRKKVTERERVISGVLRRTEAYAKEHYMGKSSKYSTKEKEVGKIVAGLGCYTERIKRLIEAMTELKIPTTTDRIEFSPLVAIVPIANSNSHDYPLNEVSIMTGRESGVRPDGGEGNNMDIRKTSSRPATPKEIRKAVYELSQEGLDRVMRNIIII